MTGKRFKATMIGITDTKNDIDFGWRKCDAGLFKLCELLNKQDERIKKLEVDNADYKSEIEYYEEQKAELEKEVGSKQRVIDVYEQYVKDLKEDGDLE